MGSIFEMLCSDAEQGRRGVLYNQGRRGVLQTGTLRRWTNRDAEGLRGVLFTGIFRLSLIDHPKTVSSHYNKRVSLAVGNNIPLSLLVVVFSSRHSSSVESRWTSIDRCSRLIGKLLHFMEALAMRIVACSATCCCRTDIIIINGGNVTNFIHLGTSPVAGIPERK